MSKVVTVGGTEAEPTATFEEAKIGDIFSTALSTDKALTGTYGLLQRVGLMLGGMAIEAKMRSDTFKPKLFGG